MKNLFDLPIIKFLGEVKHRVGPREYPLGLIKETMSLGLVAGDYSRPYLTDSGVTILNFARLVRELDYGETLYLNAESISYFFNILIELHGYQRGDDLDTTLNFEIFRPVLVVNSDKFLDVEYFSKISGKIITLEEINYGL